MAKAKTKTTREYSVKEMTNAVLSTFPELSEAYTRADIELALDDRGWEKSIYGNAANIIEADPAARQNLVTKSRLYWRRDPLAKQSVRLWTDYAFGNGMTFKADDDATQTALVDFKKKNSKLMSARGQQRISKKLLVDGDVFFAVFDGEPKELRTIEALQVTHVIADPDDEEMPLLYRRQTKNKVMYYRDWQSPDADLKGVKDPTTNRVVDKSLVQAGVVVYHAKFDDIGTFGNGLLTSVVDWTKEHRRFMEARVAITQALAKFAWKGVVKGGKAALNAVQTRLQSTLAVSGTTGGMEKNPSPAAASTWLQNDGIDMTPMPRVTGAGDAKQDSDSLKLMVCSGTGIMLHYFGDPSTGNLATATAMELPMLKQFAAYQELWKETFRDLFSIVLDEQPGEPDAVIDIDLPTILERDLTGLASFLSTLSATFPEVKIPEVLQMCLEELGINNLEDVMDKIAEEKKKQDAKAEKDAKMNQTLTMAKASNFDQKTAQQMAESHFALAKALTELSEKLG